MSMFERRWQRRLGVLGLAGLLTVAGCKGHSEEEENSGSHATSMPAGVPPADTTRPKFAASMPATSQASGHEEASNPFAYRDVEGERIKLAEGLVYIDIQTGTGEGAKTGDRVVADYTLFNSKGEPIQTSLGNAPFPFLLGRGAVIRGWDMGIVGMKAGGKRRLIVPPGLAYGATGQPPHIGPNETLIFDIQLRSIRH